MAQRQLNKLNTIYNIHSLYFNRFYYVRRVLLQKLGFFLVYLYFSALYLHPECSTIMWWLSGCVDTCLIVVVHVLALLWVAYNPLSPGMADSLWWFARLTCWSRCINLTSCDIMIMCKFWSKIRLFHVCHCTLSTRPHIIPAVFHYMAICYSGLSVTSPADWMLLWRSPWLLCWQSYSRTWLSVFSWTPYTGTHR